jgi:hypothetical protein
MTIHELHVGQKQFDIRFWRAGPETRFEVLRGAPQTVSRRSFATGTALPA